MFIKEVSAKEIVDSRGEKTIEVSVNGCSASSPAGKSTGTFETPSYHKNLEWNLSFFKKNDFSGLEINSFSDLKKLENAIKKKAKLNDVLKFGANALFAFECAVLKALAKSKGLELWQVVNSKARRLPVPAGNIIGGGLHSHDPNHPTFQEFLIIPQGKNAKENFKIMQDTHKAVGKLLAAKKVNDEGAWETHLDDLSVLQLLSKMPKVRLGCDVAANSFYCDGNYNYRNKQLDKTTQIHYINELIESFNLLYVEDPLDEDDFSGFTKIEKKNMIVGDDLTVTHLKRLKKAIKMKAINAIIVKPNQNGSLLQVAELIDFCKKNKVKTILSHRSGETLDNALADLAFGFGTDYIKCGISTKWREAKLKRLVQIESKI
ncbi:MAG TPA: enolase C-terminal domain-like protein [Candidatus Nanoarchaeia archaeon]|nr:enolase C-terminal domain-like protein [Candidatus Nanoarchaeia archaeon]